MLVLTIILIILCLLFSLTLFNAYIYAKFVNELSLILKVGFLKFQILPSKPKEKKPEKKKKKKKPKQKKKSDKEKKKEKSSPFAYLKEKGVSGIINIIKQLAILAGGTLKELFSHITITKFNIEIKIAGEDAADSAIKYGYFCSVLFPALRVIFDVVKCESYNVNVNPDFSNDPKNSVDAELVAKIRIAFLLKVLFSRAFMALRLYLKAKPKK